MGGVGLGWGGQGGCERNRSFCENSKKKKIFFLGGGGRGGGGLGWGFRVDVNEDLKFL